LAFVGNVGARPFTVLNSFDELTEYKAQNAAGDQSDRNFQFSLSCKPEVTFMFQYPTDRNFRCQTLLADIAAGYFPSLVGTDFLKNAGVEYNQAVFVVGSRDGGKTVNLVFAGRGYDVTADFVGEGFCSLVDRRK
jgi:hypothetical protein